MQIDCAIITALPKELDQLRFHFRHSEPRVDESGAYYTTVSPNGLSLVGAIGHGMGLVNAATLALNVINEYKPKTIILVGIAGGLDRRIDLGDVVVSTQIIDYELGKITPQGLDTRWSVYPVDSSLLAKAQNYRETSWADYIHTTRPQKGSRNHPSVHFGIYLSGNKVVADHAAANTFRHKWHDAAAIEMEAAGIATALRQIKDPPGFIVIKGICDYADSAKNDTWQTYAADSATSFAYSFVADQLKPNDILWPNRHTMPEMGGGHVDRVALRQVIAGGYSSEELKVLAHDLSIPWGEIGGEIYSTKVIELIGYMERRSRLAELIKKINSDRPDLLQGYIPS